jgi:hypothetical protein
MTWFDELDEQTQRQWRSRLEKGRLGLSASMEQTLVEGAAEEIWLDEDDDEGGVHVVDEHAAEVRRGTTVIPPRLSLQTKPMSTVSAASSKALIQAPTAKVDDAQGQHPSQEKQHTGVFSRLAQRITMSLAAITSPFQAQVPIPQPPAQEAHIPMPGMLTRPEMGIQTVTTVRVEHSETTTTTIIETSPPLLPAPAPAVPQVPQLPQTTQTSQGEGKSRPAGYPTKVHLEAAPSSTSLHPGAEASAKDGVVSYPAHDSTEPLPLGNTFSVPRSAPPTVELATVTPSSDATVAQSSSQSAPINQALYDMTTSGCLPSVRVPDKKSGEIAQRTKMPLPEAIFGSGNFDAGQGDVAIANAHITGTSVVTVMLASDPGPVVVQYVSLQPGTGFTVHLSAPTKVKTLFNYVVLQKEGEG